MNNIKSLLPKNKYPLLLVAHILLGAMLYWRPGYCKYFSLVVFFTGIALIVKNKNRNHEMLLVSAYMIGCEVLFRMSYAVSYEFTKYSLLVFATLGILFSGFSKKSWLYFLYLLLLLPSLFLLDDFWSLPKRDINIILLNILGPFCVGMLSIYCFDKKIGFAMLNKILLCVALPILSIATYVILFSPETSQIVSVESNHYFSGSFGPNQVATVFGLGMFVFFYRAVLLSESITSFVTNIAIVALFTYSGLITFSRGGILVGVAAIIVVAILIYIHSESYGKWKVKTGISAFLISLLAIFLLVNYQTDGLIFKRYTNRDHLGRFKKEKPYSRAAIATEEVKMFIDNPVMGVGVTKAEKTRSEESGREIHSHDEITRMLAEHGSLGFIGLLILLVTPAWLFFYAKRNIFLGAFFVFWFLTINHSGMRIAAPAFFYALMLLNVDLSPVVFFTQKLPERSPLLRFFTARTAN